MCVCVSQGPSDSLGISIAGGVGSPLGDVPIFIAMMNPSGLAAQTQKLWVRVGLTSEPELKPLFFCPVEGLTH